MADEKGDVVASLPQRVERHRRPSDAMVEIRAEGPLADHVGQVAVGGGYQAELALPEAVGGHRPDGLLQDTQELCPQRGFELTQLVEEERWSGLFAGA